MANKKNSGGHLLINCLKAQGVKYIFGIPGAKIDAVFDAINDVDGIELILCRHEQNACFMAAMIGRLTGNPGVVLVTSGPGVSNLATGLITATTEGDPIVAIGGSVPRNMQLKHTHQGMDNVSLTKNITKSSVDVLAAENIPEVVDNAFRTAIQGRPGATFISLPQDISSGEVNIDIIAASTELQQGAADDAQINQAAALTNQAKLPVILLGLDASKPKITTAIRKLLENTALPVVSTYQAAGVISRGLLDCFIGRVGLFNNQPGDHLLQEADVIITIGFDAVEYDPIIWHKDSKAEIIHIDTVPAEIDRCYHPKLELLGDIAKTLAILGNALNNRKSLLEQDNIKGFREALHQQIHNIPCSEKMPMHPLRIIHDLQSVVEDDMTVCCDIGTHYMWMARNFLSYQPRRLLFSNGQQTLGVALPWAMATNLARPGEKVISVSGDGGFLFSAMELETAVRIGCNFVHIIWRDGSYNMVAAQEQMKYNRTTGVEFGKIDIEKFAESFGAKGHLINNADEFLPTLKQALQTPVVTLIDVPVDYSDNQKLFETIDWNMIH